MQLYTREELLKRAWIADSVQADIMIEAIAASYNGDINTFDCLINKVANLHWLSDRIKCVDPSIGETSVELSSEEVSQVSSITMGAYSDFTNYQFTITQTDSNGDLIIFAPTYLSLPPDTMDVVIADLIGQINTSTVFVTATGGAAANEIVMTAMGGYPIFIVEPLSPSQVLTLVTAGSSITKYTTSVEYSERCLTDEQIQAIVLNIELLAGSPCGCDPNIFLTDTIPNIIKYTSPSFSTVIPYNGPPGSGATQRDFNSPDFNSQDFA